MLDGVGGEGKKQGLNGFSDLDFLGGAQSSGLFPVVLGKREC